MGDGSCSRIAAMTVASRDASGHHWQKWRKYFDRDLALQPGIPRAIHFTLRLAEELMISYVCHGKVEEFTRSGGGGLTSQFELRGDPLRFFQCRGIPGLD
jgi:hypothetical protein